MSTLKMHEKAIFESLFDKGGRVLSFTRNKFSEFFREHSINIDAKKYQSNGPSTMKRLRAFWEKEPDHVVGKVLEALLRYAHSEKDINPTEEEIDPKLNSKAKKIICRLLDQNYKSTDIQDKEDEVDEFLKQEFTDISIKRLNLDNNITEILEQRIKEIQQCLQSKSPLATIFLCGSTLEGILLGIALKNPKIFNSEKICPKDKNSGKVLQFHKWTLSHFIDVAKDTGFLDEDVKKFSHALRDFRNYIHPYEQSTKQFNPNEHTAKICFHVLQAAIHQINKKMQ